MPDSVPKHPLASHLHLAPFREGDERAILSLYQSVHGRALSIDRWRWQYLECPWGQSEVWLAWDGDVLAGHYALLPIRLGSGLGRISGRLSLDTMTHQDYRGLGVFSTLASQAFSHAGQKGAAFVCGFPNDQSWPFYRLL